MHQTKIYQMETGLEIDFFSFCCALFYVQGFSLFFEYFSLVVVVEVVVDGTKVFCAQLSLASCAYAPSFWIVFCSSDAMVECLMDGQLCWMV